MRYLIFFLIILGASLANAGPVRLQKVKPDLYKDLNTDRLIRTRNCGQDAYWDQAWLNYDERYKNYGGKLAYRNKVTFSNKRICEVEDVYKPGERKQK